MFIKIVMFFLIILQDKNVNGLKCDNPMVTSIGVNTMADLISNLSADFTFNRSLANVQSKISYKSTTFAESKKVLFKNDTVQPVFSTVVFQSTTPDEKLQYPNIKTFPVLAGAIVLIFNIPGVKNLTLSVNIASQIYQGIINYWNDVKIQELNPNVNLPNEEIRTVARSDVAGETDAFVDGLSKGDDQWKQLYGKFDNPQFVSGQCCNSTKWPSNVVDLFGNTITGMIGIVLSIPYTIGYTAYPNAVNNNLSFASLVNSAGKVTLPTVTAMQSAMDYFLTINGGFSYELSNAKTSDAYPIASFVYFMVNISTDPSVSCCDAREFVAFVDWLVFNVNESVIADFGLVKLSPLLAGEIQRSVLQAITCHRESLYSSYLSTLIKPSTSLEMWVILMIAIVVTIGASVIVVMLVYVAHFQRQKQAQEMNWLLPLGLIRMKSSHKEYVTNKDDDEPPLPGSSSKSASSSESGTLYTNHAERLKHVLLMGTENDVIVFLDKLENFVNPMMWKKQTKKLFKKLTNEIAHRNVLRLRGATMWDIFTFAVFDNCNKGTLHYVLQTCKYNLTDTVKFNLVMDVIEGLKFLQSRNVIHGYINSLSCVVESSWNVKISQWHRHTLIAVEHPASLQTMPAYQPDKLMEMCEIIELLYIDHETYPNFTLLTDIFSLGFIMVEIFTKKIPYNDEVEASQMSYPNIFKTKFIERKSPRLPKMEPDLVPEKVKEIIKSALSNVEVRPNIRQIGVALKKAKPSDKGIVDAMMEIIESHTETLEQKTNQLQEITQRMQELLHEILPPQIADKLFQGELVPPESFENATVCFADIVGFTVISAKSRPHEIMSFLNDIWTSFDSIIQKFDVYKVDTIGDAYMVCSGLPVRNGTLHCKNIASLSLALVDECENFMIYHIPNERVQIRLGVNTGPVIAGIVGSKMPQYCVFGDAVNTAARMQTTSIPMKIQLSESSYQLLDMHYPQFETQSRGEIEVKGKGLMKTYWLEKEKSLRHSPLSMFNSLMTQNV